MCLTLRKIAAPPSEVRAGAQCTHACARRFVVDRERARDPRAALLGMAVRKPQPPQCPDDPEGLLAMTMIDVPCECRTEVVVLGFQALQAGLLVRPEEPRCQVAGE